MKCLECGKDKLSREFPKTEHSENCEHPQRCCLRCAVKLLLAKETACPYPGCHEQTSEDFLELCEEEIEYQFPSPPSVMQSAIAQPVATTGARTTSMSTGGIVIATFLSGEHCSVPYDPRKTIAQLRTEIQNEMDVAATKQKLFFGETELSPFTSQQTAATLAYYRIEPGSSIQVHVQLYEIEAGLKEVVFDLSWGYPRGSRRRDYLDATAFCYHGTKQLAFTDFRRNHNYEVQLDGVIHHSGHDGGLNRRQTGRHRITINFDYISDKVDTIFITLSSFHAPNMGQFQTPTLDFYDPAWPDKQLCDNYVRSAPDSKGIVMCSVRRTAQGWTVFGIGRPTAGNAADYQPIRQTLYQIAREYRRQNARQWH